VRNEIGRVEPSPWPEDVCKRCGVRRLMKLKDIDRDGCGRTFELLVCPCRFRNERVNDAKR
jgi:hypothetical protein